MRHLKQRHRLGVEKEHRLALMANLAVALITHGRIKTTLAKAKALRPYIEKIITMAKKAKEAEPARSVHLRRLAISRIRDKSAVKTLFNEKVDEFVNRNGGYTRIYKLGPRRGDAAEMAIIEFIAGDDQGYGSTRGEPEREQEVKADPDSSAKASKKTSKTDEQAAGKKVKAEKAEKSEAENKK